MREILFRGKRLYNGEWVYGDLLTKDKNGNYCPRIKNSESYPFSFQVDPATVGQYIGLTDKNGNKIFEGDILRVLLFDHTERFNFHTIVVKWDEDYSEVVCEDVNDKTCKWELRVLLDYDESLIIGNIWDNLELLKENK